MKTGADDGFHFEMDSTRAVLLFIGLAVCLTVTCSYGAHETRRTDEAKYRSQETCIRAGHSVAECKELSK